MAKAAQPAGPETGEVARPQSTSDEIAAFLDRTKGLVRHDRRPGRLIFAMDATMSRQATWDLALQLQADMFEAVREVGGLDVQLVYFRGLGECRASKWVNQPKALAKAMGQVSCRGGLTQIGKVLAYARRQAALQKVNAVVYVGDCMEENIDRLSQRAGELRLLNAPVFLFQEGRDPVAASAFKEIARLSGGGYAPFDAGSAAQLRALLKAVAIYASGGRKALAAFSEAEPNRAVFRLLEQIN
jgi:hypothetical protein